MNEELPNFADWLSTYSLECLNGIQDAMANNLCTVANTKHLEMPTTTTQQTQNTGAVYSSSHVPIYSESSTENDLGNPYHSNGVFSGGYISPTSSDWDLDTPDKTLPSCVRNGDIDMFSEHFDSERAGLMQQTFPQLNATGQSNLFAGFSFQDINDLEIAPASYDRRILSSATESSFIPPYQLEGFENQGFTQLAPDISMGSASFPEPQGQVVPQQQLLGLVQSCRPRISPENDSLPGCSRFSANPEYSFPCGGDSRNGNIIRTTRTNNPCQRCVDMKSRCSGDRPCKTCQDVQRGAAKSGRKLRHPECIDSYLKDVRIFTQMVLQGTENAPIFGLNFPETRWFVNIRFPKKEKLDELSKFASELGIDADADAVKHMLNFDPFNHVEPIVSIPAVAATGRRAKVPRIIANRFENCFFQLHHDVFRPQLNESNDEYNETILLWQGVTVYHIIAVIQSGTKYDHTNGASIEEVRDFSSEVCQWAISLLKANLKRTAGLSLMQKCVLWMDLFALNQLMRKEEQGVLEKLAGLAEFSRLKSMLNFHVKRLDRELSEEIEFLLEGILEKENIQRDKKFGENTLWLEFLNWRWKMVQVAEVYRIDVSEDEYEEMENPFCD